MESLFQDIFLQREFFHEIANYKFYIPQIQSITVLIFIP